MIFEFQVSDEVNGTVSTLKLVPAMEDDGRIVTCRAQTPSLTGGFVEDSWRMQVHCKCHTIDFHRTTNKIVTVYPISITQSAHSPCEGQYLLFWSSCTQLALVWFNSIFLLLRSSEGQLGSWSTHHCWRDQRRWRRIPGMPRSSIAQHSSPYMDSQCMLKTYYLCCFPSFFVF